MSNLFFWEGFYFQENFIWKTSILKTRIQSCLRNWAQNGQFLTLDSPIFFFFEGLHFTKKKKKMLAPIFGSRDRKFWDWNNFIPQKKKKKLSNFKNFNFFLNCFKTISVVTPNPQFFRKSILKLFCSSNFLIYPHPKKIAISVNNWPRLTTLLSKYAESIKLSSTLYN